MDGRHILASQLINTAGLIEWAIAQVPPRRLFEAPPHGDQPKRDHGFNTYLGQWSACRLLFQHLHYEQAYAHPAMRTGLGGPPAMGDLMLPDPNEERQTWSREQEAGVELPTLLDRFRALRREQVEVMRAIPGREWATERVETEFGPVSADFVTIESVQHTLEHGNGILKNALYWDRAVE